MLNSTSNTWIQRPAIILVGYMCVGKTTIGKSLAKQLGCTFYDLDWYIEERFRTKVPRIFAEQGEEKFRDMERRMLHEVAEFQNIVLSCGGGTPCFFDNIDYMNRQGKVVYLKVSPEVLYEHLKMGKSVRPLLLNKTPEQVREFIVEQLAHREQFYSKADYTLDINLLDNHDKINITVDKLQKLIEK